MAFVAVRRLTDRLREEAEKERQRYAVRSQAANFRRWMRSEGAFDDFAGLMTPGSLNPLGMAYEASRMEEEDPRPSRFADEQEGETPSLLQEIARGFAPADPTERARWAFRGLGGEEAGAEIARRFGAAVQTPDQQEEMRRIGALLEEQQTTPAQVGQMPFGERLNLLSPALQAAGSQSLDPSLSQRLRQAGRLAVGAGREGLNLLEAEVEFGRPATAPVGRFLGNVALEGVAPATLRRVGVPLPEPRLPGLDVARRLGAPLPDIRPREVAEKIGEVAGPEVFVASNLLPIPIVDDVLRVLAKGVPLAARLLSREGRMASRAELSRLVTQIKTLGRRSPELAGQADQAVADIERALLRPEAEAVPQAVPAREPTVRQVDLEGRELDTFATERERAGIRETQAGLPMGAGELPPETAGPLFAAQQTPLDTALRDIAEERRLAQSLLDDPRTRRMKGEAAAQRTRLAALDEEEAIVRDWQRRGLSSDQQAAELAELEQRLAGQALRAEMRTPGRATMRGPAFGTAEAAEREIAMRGRRPAWQRREIEGPGLPRQEIEARGEALDQLRGRLGLPEERLPVEAAPEPVPATGGGAPLSAERLAAREAPEAVTEVLTAKPSRVVREAWRKYDGAQKASAIQRRVWANEVYDEAEAAGLRIAREGDAQSDEVVGLLERAFGDEAERGRLGAFRPEERPVAQRLYTRIDDARARLQIADPEFDTQAIPEYFPHLFKVTKPKGGGVAGFRLKPGFKKPRKLEGTLAQILENRPDLDLVTWDPVAYVTRFEASVDNYIASLEAIRGLRATGLIRPARGAPADWRLPDVSPFKVRQALQNTVAEPKVAMGLEQMFGKSAFDQHGALRLAKSTRENLFRIKVFGGLFQGIDYTLRSLGLGLSEAVRLRPKAAAQGWFNPLRAVARAAVPGLDARMLKVAAESPKLQALHKAGLSAGVDPSLSEKAIRGLEGFVPQTVAGRQIPGAEGLADVVEFMSGGAYHKFHQDMLEQAGLIILEKQLRRGVPLEEAARLAVEETNVFFSSIPNWQSAVKSSTGRDLMKFPIFAIGEFEAWFRLPVQAPAGFAGIIGATVIAAEMLNKLSTGHWLTLEQLKPYELDPEEVKEIRKGPQAIFKTGVPGVDYNTKFLRPELPWKGPLGRVLYLDILGQADTPFRFALDPMFAITTRLGQFPRAGLDLAAIAQGGRPAFGEPVESPAGFAKFAAQQVSPISVSGLAGAERERIGVAGAGAQVGGVNVMGEALRDLLARRFEDIHGRPFNPEVDFAIAQQDSQLQPILDEMNRLGVQFGSESAIEREERAGFLAERESELRLPQKAASVLRGNIAAVAGFNEAYEDFRSTAADAAARDFFGTEPREAETPEGRRYDEYREISPWDQRFQNPETGEIDWDLYRPVKDAAFARLPRELQQAIENRTSLQDEEAIRLAAALRGWRDELDPYYAEEDGRARESFRRRPANARIDAILWITGSVTSVLTARARSLAVDMLRDELGVRIDANDVPRRAPRGGGRERRR